MGARTNGSPPQWEPEHRKPGMFPPPPDQNGDQEPDTRRDGPPSEPPTVEAVDPAAPADTARPSEPEAEPTPDPAVTNRFEPPPDRSERLFKAVPPKEPRSGRTGLLGVRRALSSLLRQRRRIVLSTIIVALGIAYLAGSLSLLHRVGNGLANLSGAGTERSDLVLEGDISFDSPLEQVRNLIPDAIGDDVQHVDGVKAVDPRVESTGDHRRPERPDRGVRHHRTTGSRELAHRGRPQPVPIRRCRQGAAR